MSASDLTRRDLLQGAAALAVLPSFAGAADKAVSNGHIKQSIVFWCFNTAGEKWDVEKTCQAAKELGVGSIEIIGPEHWPTLKKQDACQPANSTR